MGLKSALSKPFAAWVNRQVLRWKNNPIAAQDKVFRALLNKAKLTAFGQDHGFETIQTYQDRDRPNNGCYYCHPLWGI